MQPAIKDDLTYQIIGCAMKVHGTLGNGFQELIYQRCLKIEMEKQGLRFARELEMQIYYEDPLCELNNCMFNIVCWPFKYKIIDELYNSQSSYF